MTLRTLNYGNYGIFLIMGNSGFCPSTVGLGFREIEIERVREIEIERVRERERERGGENLCLFLCGFLLQIAYTHVYGLTGAAGASSGTSLVSVVSGFRRFWYMQLPSKPKR